MAVKNKDIEIPLCYIRNDINHFIRLVTQWGPLKNSIYPSTKEIITRAMGLIVLCTSIKDAEKIAEALFDIILSKYDGSIENTETWTPCFKAKRYLQSLVTTSVLNIVEFVENDHQSNEEGNHNIDTNNEDDYTEDTNMNIRYMKTFKDWAQSIADRSRNKVESVKGISNNAQYLFALEPILIRTLKLFPCWSAIMCEKFGYGSETASSSRIEGNFNRIKNRIFRNEHLPIRVDLFVEKLISYNKGDQLLIEGETYGGSPVDNFDNNATSDTQNNVHLSDDSMNNDLISTQNDFDSVQKQLSRSFEENDEIHQSELSSLQVIPVSQNITPISNLGNQKQSSCSACNNGHFPQGAHKCLQCGKYVHLLSGCSISIPGTEEGYGENRLCCYCDDKNSKEAEINANENWSKKGKLQNSTRSSRSYLVRQPSFEFLDLNKKGSITPVVLLKNRNSLLSKPILIPEKGKTVLNNTCSVDSILSILATSAADSIEFRKYLSNMAFVNMTARVSMQMIREKKTKEIYLNRMLLILEHFESKVETLVSGLKVVDTTDTAASMFDKLMKQMPSFIITSSCKNSSCNTPIMEILSTKLSVNIFSDQIQIDHELKDFLKNSNEDCLYCGHERCKSVKTTTHICVELNSIPIGFEASTSMLIIEENHWIQLNKTLSDKLNDIPNCIVANDKNYFIRGVIIFHGGERRGLRTATGHYTACTYRGNNKWEIYDDIKTKIQQVASSHKDDIEILSYTL